jgi:cell division protein FtsN
MPTSSRDLKGRKVTTKKPVPGYVWMFAGLFIGLFFAFLVFLSKQPAEDISFSESVKQELQKAREQKKNIAAKKEVVTTNTLDSKPSNDKPRFEFYTILSELEVFVPEPEIKETNKTESIEGRGNAISDNSSDKKYLLQAGSFRSNADAERLKATLGLLGVQSSIESVSINNDSWHRVRIGPFSNPNHLRETLSTLKQNNIHAMTMELK